MTIQTFGTIIGIGNIALLIAVISIIIMRIVFGKESVFIKTIVKYALPIGFILGFAALAGSLTYSQIYGLTPCLFCWWQRVLIYPQVLFFAIAWYRSSKNNNELSIFNYTTPLAIIGTLVSLYHILLQRGIVGANGSGSCILNGTPCNIISTQILGFITIPVMAFSIGLALTVLGYLVLNNKKTA